jgi:hypothetical protein
MNNPEVAYNTASNTAIGGVRRSTFYRVGASGETTKNPYIHDNYANPANMTTVLSTRGTDLSGLVKGETSC